MLAEDFNAPPPYCICKRAEDDWLRARRHPAAAPLRANYTASSTAHFI